MLGYLSNIGCYEFAAHFTACKNSVHLPSHHADNLKYGYTDAVGYNKRRFGSTPEVDLMKKMTNGEKTA